MGSKRKLGMGSDNNREEETQLDLERSIKELYRKKGAPQQGDQAKKVELISKLEEARQKEADREQKARRSAWSEEVRRSIKGNAEFREIMEEVALEEVEVEEKPGMSRMSMEWREAFKSDRAGFLFPQVLSTLLKLTLMEGPQPEILDYRLVCKSAKESVDALLSSNHFFLQERFEEDAYYLPSGYYGTLDISDIDSFERARALTRQFRNAANPFFTRTIDVYISQVQISRFLKEMEVILRRWGKELWSVILYFHENVPVLFMYDLLVTWLKLMPHLRALRLSTSDQINITKLRKHIVKNPLPEIPGLAYISTDSATPSPVIHAMLSKYSSSLREITLDIGMDDDEPTKVFHTVSNCPPPATVEGNFSALQEMGHWYYQLEGVADIRSIFNNFNNWRLPLKRLELGLQKEVGLIHEVNEVLTAKGLFLEMPQLEELHLCMVRRITLTGLDFLLPCKGLKVLVLRFVKVIRTRKGSSEQRQPTETGILQVPLDDPNKDCLYQSRVWKLFPELRRLELHRTSIKEEGEAQDGIKPVTIEEMDSYRFTREEYLQRVGLQIGN